MHGMLRHATAGQSRSLGPFLSEGDFKSVLTGLAIAATDIKLVKNGGAAVTKNAGGATHRVNGVYGLTLDATDTDTVGELEISVLVAGALVVFETFVVLEEAVYDAFYAPGALGYVANAPVNVTQYGGVAGQFAAGRPAVNTTHVAGTPQTAGDVVADTNDIQARLPAALVGGRMDATVGALGPNAVTAATLAPDAVAEIAAGVNDDLVEGAITVRQSLRLANAANGGKLAGAGTSNINIRDLGDTKNRITATVDSAGNRNAVAVDLS